MLGKLVGKIVDTGGDVLRRVHEGKITLAEGEKELRLRAMDLEEAVVSGQIQLNLADAQSGDRFRTWWRPFACWMLVLSVTVIVALLVIVAAVTAYGIPPNAGWAETVLTLLERLLLVLTAAMGIREGGKAWGNN